MSKFVNGVQVGDSDLLWRWQINDEKNENRIISMAYNVLTSVSKSLLRDSQRPGRNGRTN